MKQGDAIDDVPINNPHPGKHNPLAADAENQAFKRKKRKTSHQNPMLPPHNLRSSSRPILAQPVPPQTRDVRDPRNNMINPRDVNWIQANNFDQIIRVSMQQQQQAEPSCKEHKELNREEIAYLKTIPDEQRVRYMNRLKLLSNEVDCPRRFRVLNSELPNQKEIFKRLDRCESPKYEQWDESALRIPLGNFSPPPVDISKPQLVSQYVENIRTIMDAEIYGQMNAKNEVMRMVCQWLKGEGKAYSLALEGLPGIGKTTFAKSVLSKAFNRPFQFISLGGCSDSAFLTGHSYTYEGALHGRIVDAVISSGVMDPIIYFDELDKISKTAKGDEIVNTLIHLTDASQNNHYRDKYFHGINIDLSKAIFVFSYNNVKDVSPILLDRLNIVYMDPPTLDSKIKIAQLHLLPRIYTDCHMNVHFSESTLRDIVSRFTQEAGVRNLERCLKRLVSTLNVLTCNNADPILPNAITERTGISQEFIDYVLSDKSEKPGTYIASMYT